MRGTQHEARILNPSNVPAPFTNKTQHSIRQSIASSRSLIIVSQSCGLYKHSEEETGQAWPDLVRSIAGSRRTRRPTGLHDSSAELQRCLPSASPHLHEASPAARWLWTRFMPWQTERSSFAVHPTPTAPRWKGRRAMEALAASSANAAPRSSHGLRVDEQRMAIRPSDRLIDFRPNARPRVHTKNNRFRLRSGLQMRFATI
jgi:hypothetical protein